MTRTTPRAHASVIYNGVKTAWKQVVQDLGGVDATAACTRTTRSLASDYGSLNSERFPPADVILDAETVSGTPHVTAALARAQGYELIPVTAQDDSALAVIMARIGRDTATLFGDAVEAIQADILRPSQCQALIAELDAVRRDAAAGIAMLTLRGDRGK